MNPLMLMWLVQQMQGRLGPRPAPPVVPPRDMNGMPSRRPGDAALGYPGYPGFPSSLPRPGAPSLFPPAGGTEGWAQPTQWGKAFSNPSASLMSKLAGPAAWFMSQPSSSRGPAPAQAIPTYQGWQRSSAQEKRRAQNAEPAPVSRAPGSEGFYWMGEGY